MMLSPLDIAPFAPTDKRPGDKVIHSHRAYEVQPDGSWRSLDAREAIEDATARTDNALGLLLAITAAIISLTCLVVGWLGVTGRI